MSVYDKIIALTRTKRVQVPPYPAVALRLHEVTSRPNFAITDVVDVVSADQALTATILRAANSALYGAMGAATTLQQAVARLGASEVARLALAAGLAETMRIPGTLQQMRRQAWAEGVASAAVSHALARLRGLSQRDAFTCGLLHDFPKIVGLAALEQMIAADSTIAPNTEEMWREALGWVLPELGDLVATTWNLPPLLQEAMTLRTPAEWTKSKNGALLEVIGASDQVIALMMSSSHVSPADLAVLKLLRPGEHEPLAEMLPSVPATINAFESDQLPKAVPSKIVLPPTSLGTEPLRPLRLPVQQNQPAKRGPFQMTGINNAGWSMSGEHSLPERQMFEATITLPAPSSKGGADAPASPPPIKFWASTSLCAPDGKGFRIECKPFALDRDGKRRWAELVQSAKGQATTPAAHAS